MTSQGANNKECHCECTSSSVCTLEQLKKQQDKLQSDFQFLKQTVTNHGKLIDQLPVCTISEQVIAEKEKNAPNTGGIFNFWPKDEEKLKKECEALKKEVSQLKQSNEKLKTVEAKVKKECEDWKKEASQLKKNKEKLERDLQKLLEEKKRRKARVRIYSPGGQSVVQQILLEFTIHLKSLMSSRDGVELTVDQISEPGESEAFPPLLVICCNASRLGTDVDRALQGVTCKQKSMVVILHHKDIHALPSQASNKLLIGQVYKTLAGMTDMAFTSGKGLYNCDMNNRAIDTIAHFIIQKQLD